MKLMQSLLTDGTLEESEVSKLSGGDIVRWKKRNAEIDRAINTLEAAFKNDSQLATLIKDLGGDLGAFTACVRATSKLVDEWEELQMNVGMTIHNGDED
jgi:ABC-type enterochelin transport system substrate-binding protein